MKKRLSLDNLYFEYLLYTAMAVKADTLASAFLRVLDIVTGKKKNIFF